MENMKPVNWNTEKNIRLKAERGVSFEEVLSAMSPMSVINTGLAKPWIWPGSVLGESMPPLPSRG